jgi:hypothetical protein
MNWEPSAWQRGGNSATILGIIRKNAVHASLKGDGRFTGMPRMTLRIRFAHGSFARYAGSCVGCARGAAARWIVKSHVSL